MGVRLDRWACGALYDRIRLTTMEEALPERGAGGGGAPPGRNERPARGWPQDESAAGG